MGRTLLIPGKSCTGSQVPREVYSQPKEQDVFEAFFATDLGMLVLVTSMDGLVFSGKNSKIDEVYKKIKETVDHV